MANQKNLQWYRYITDGGVNMALMADVDWGANAASGLANFNSADPPFGPHTRTHTPRKAVYRDPITFRTTIHPVGTTAAMAALPSTIQVFVPGNVAAVTYNLSRRVAEKLRVPQASSHLVDHA